jgi:hypothetical protein
MAGGLIGMNIERGRQAQQTLLGLAAQEQSMNAANAQIRAAEKAEKMGMLGTGAGIGAKLGIEATKAAAAKGATTAGTTALTAAPTTTGLELASTYGVGSGGGTAAAALETGAAAAGTTAAATGAEAAAASTAAAGASGGGSAALAAAPWVLGGMAVAYLLSELFD